MTSGIPTIAPFRGVRYDPQKIADFRLVTAPPYDVISEIQQNRLYERSPYNVVRLILGRQYPADTEENNRYTRAVSDFKSWLQSGVLIRDPEPSVYLYEQSFEVFEIRGQGRFTRRGFLALRRLEEFEKGRIRPHEKTLSGPKADRLLLIKACGANFSPIFSLYSDPDHQWTNLLEPFFKIPSQVDFSDDEGIRHRLWRVSDPALFQKMNEILGGKNLFIADGHHRYETAIAYRDWMKKQFPHSTDDAAFNYVMMFFGEMSDPGLIILPTHRVLQNWPGFDAGNFKERLKEFFDFKTFAKDRKEAFLSELSNLRDRRAIGILFPQEPGHHLIIPKPAAFQSIDTAILHQTIFRDVLKFKDEDEKDPRHLRFIKEMEEGFEALKDPQVNCVFLMNCPRMEDLRKVVESGQILPPKTTYFYPKLITGLVMNQIDPRDSVVI